jgi:glycosyltransferase involved in cell wall biosynthesis
MNAREDRQVSVVIPVYNGERFVGDAIASVLGQTQPPRELLVVDDASEDGTGQVVRSFANVRYVRVPANRGQAAALNLGVSSTSGPYLAFLDADDIWVPEKLERQFGALDADAAFDVVYGLMRERVLEADGCTWREGKVCVAQLPSAMLIKRSAFDRVGCFDSRWTLGSVVDWYTRACETGLRQYVLPEVVYERRIHGANVGLRRTELRGDYLAVVKAALERRRSCGVQEQSAKRT